MKKLFCWMACLVLWASPLWAAPLIPSPILDSHPRELDLGIIRPDKVVHATITLSKIGEGDLAWQLDDSGIGRKLDTRRLRGNLKGASQEVIVALKYSRVVAQNHGQEGPAGPRRIVQLMVLSGEENVRYALDEGLGSRRVVLVFRSADSAQEVGVRYEVSDREEPLLNVEPLELDFGTVEADRNQNAQLRITNRGVKMLHWKVGLPTMLQDRGRFMSLLNEEVRGRGDYVLPVRLNRTLQLYGAWQEVDGYPASSNPESPLMIGFTGNAVALSVRKDVQGGVLTMSLDDRPVETFDCRTDRREIVELPVSEPLLEGPHILKLVASAGEVVLTGVRLRARDVLPGPAGWIKVFPDVGDTMSEMDYVNVKLQADRLEPGSYAGTLLVQSDGGDVPVDVSVRVVGSGAARILPVYQYVRGMDYLFSTNPEREDQVVLSYYTRKQGIAFRLFRDNTPGTKRLLRWYHAGIGDHYYACEGDGAKRPMQGYMAEGSIGSIATSRLQGTRELYRWFNPQTGLHAYTLDSKGEGLKKGYTFDGIVGYVPIAGCSKTLTCGVTLWPAVLTY